MDDLKELSTSMSKNCPLFALVLFSGVRTLQFYFLLKEAAKIYPILRSNIEYIVIILHLAQIIATFLEFFRYLSLYIRMRGTIG